MSRDIDALYWADPLYVRDSLISEQPYGRHWKWIAAVVSVLIALAVAEGLLRVLLFHTPGDSPAKNPDYYARSGDEVWVYRYLFSATKRWAIRAAADGSGPKDAARETGIEFYRNWSASLMPDAELGYLRKPNVRTPCHETTSIGSRGTRDYSPGGPKLVFVGDSFVESAACSADTLPAKIERLTGIDTLNYGVGGYGLDQMLLLFERILPRFDSQNSIFLIGLINDDLDRVLLKVRDSPKPYFTIADQGLVLHTEHIHPNSLNDYFERPPERLYLYYFVRGKLGFPNYRSVLERTRAERRKTMYAISEMLVERFAELQRRGGFPLAIVIFPTPGAPFDPTMLSLFRAHGIPVVDLQGCLRESGNPDRELYAELHPTSLGNEILARCLVGDLKTIGFLKERSGAGPAN